MTDFNFKNQSVAGVALALIVGGGGLNILSEGAEEKAIEAMIAVDVVQDEKYADLLQRHNDLVTEVALLRQRVDTP